MVQALNSLFLFAHQDDEFGVFAQIEREVQAGRRVACLYVTDGAANSNPERRNAESLAVLQNLGVSFADVIFLGQQLDIGDGKLYLRVRILKDWIDIFFDAQFGLETCFVPAWEGGHPDHDLLHAIAVESLAARDCNIKVWQYSLYHGQNCAGPLFRALSPLPENGPVNQFSITWRDRFRYVRLCLSYPSQWRSWIGLFPFVGSHYLFSGVQQLQHVSMVRLQQPPHDRPLYYERRAFLDWPTLHAAYKQISGHK